MRTLEMPRLGSSMIEAKILRWLKQEGDTITRGEYVAEIETDKSNIVIDASTGGVLRKILVPEGQSALPGTAIALIGSPDEPMRAHLNGNMEQSR